jgi:phosphoglycerate dehydrogenase-like enzyme
MLSALAVEAYKPPVVLVFETQEYFGEVVRHCNWLLPQGTFEFLQCDATNCSSAPGLDRAIAVVGRVPSELVPKLPNIQLLQTHSYMYPKLETVPAHITVARYSPVTSPEPMAEFVIASTFEWQYQLKAREQKFLDCAWASDAPKHCPSASDLTRHETLMEKTMGVLGFGKIGYAVAKRAVALGMRTVATKHSPPFTSDLPLAWIGNDNDKLLRESDYVVVAVPGTLEGVINATSLGLMKPGAVVIPVSAGPVDFEALRAAIAQKSVGAVLDVWDEGCWHFPDYTCGAPYGEPSFPHHVHMERTDGAGALVLPGMMMRDGRFWSESAMFVAENIASLFISQPLKGVVRNGTKAITV